MPSSKGSSWPRDQTHISYVSCIGRQVLYHWCHLGSPGKQDNYMQRIRLDYSLTAGTKINLNGIILCFLWLNNIPLHYTYHIFIIDSSVDGPLGCFHILAIVNSAVMNIVVHVSFRIGYIFRENHNLKRYMCLGVAYGSSIFSWGKGD